MHAHTAAKHPESIAKSGGYRADCPYSIAKTKEDVKTQETKAMRKNAEKQLFAGGIALTKPRRVCYTMKKCDSVP